MLLADVVKCASDTSLQKAEKRFTMVDVDFRAVRFFADKLFLPMVHGLTFYVRQINCLVTRVGIGVDG